MPTCSDCSLTVTNEVAQATDNECPSCGAQLIGDEAVIASKGDVLHVVVLGEQTLREIALIMPLNNCAEIMMAQEGVIPYQLKATYEARMQQLIDWLIRHRGQQVFEAMRKL